MWTVTPARSSPASSHSPVCRPARRSTSRPRAASHHRERAPDRPRRAVEGGEHAVAGAADRAPAVDGDLLVDDAVVAGDQVVPAPVAEPRRVLGRADDVGEHDRRQDPVRIADAARAGDELLDLVEQRVRVADEVDVVVAGQLDVARARYVLGQVAGVGDVDQAVAAAVHDQRRDPDRRKHRAHVDAR